MILFFPFFLCFFLLPLLLLFITRIMLFIEVSKYNWKLFLTEEPRVMVDVTWWKKLTNWMSRLQVMDLGMSCNYATLKYKLAIEAFDAWFEILFVLVDTSTGHMILPRPTPKVSAIWNFRICSSLRCCSNFEMTFQIVWFILSEMSTFKSI